MNAAMLLLVAGSLTPAQATPTPISPLVLAPKVMATFANPMAVLQAAKPPAAAPAEKRLRVHVGGGAWLHPGQYVVFGGGVSFKPMKDKPELAIQADVYIGPYTTSTYVVQSAAAGGLNEATTPTSFVQGLEAAGLYEDSTSIFALIGFNVLYTLPVMKTSSWKTHLGAGLMIDKGNGYTDAYFDVKILFTHLMGSKELRPEFRFAFGSSVVIVGLFSVGF